MLVGRFIKEFSQNSISHIGHLAGSSILDTNFKVFVIEQGVLYSIIGPENVFMQIVM